MLLPRNENTTEAYINNYYYDISMNLLIHTKHEISTISMTA